MVLAKHHYSCSLEACTKWAIKSCLTTSTIDIYTEQQPSPRITSPHKTRRYIVKDLEANKGAFWLDSWDGLPDHPYEQL